MLVEVARQPFLPPLDASDVRDVLTGCHDIRVVFVNVGEGMVPQGVLQEEGV